MSSSWSWSQWLSLFCDLAGHECTSEGLLSWLEVLRCCSICLTAGICFIYHRRHSFKRAPTPDVEDTSAARSPCCIPSHPPDGKLEAMCLSCNGPWRGISSAEIRRSLWLFSMDVGLSSEEVRSSLPSENQEYQVYKSVLHFASVR